nr:MAG: hypothetical protein [Lake Baikal virophage 9]
MSTIVPSIISCSWLDNEAEDLELISISVANSATIYPTHVKLIIDNVSNTSSGLSQKVINLQNGDYTYNDSNYLINVRITVIENKNYTIKAKVFFSDASSSQYSGIKPFTTGPTTPVIISGFGDAISSIFLSIQPQSEVLNYSAILSYKDYTNIQQLDVVDNITTTDNTKQFLKLTNLVQNIDYKINLIASNANGQSQISNSIVCSTRPQPDPVTNFIVTFTPDLDFFLNWTAPLNSIHLPVTKYRLFWASFLGVNMQIYGEIFIDGLLETYTLPSNMPNLRYEFYISAIHSDVNDKNKDLMIDYQSSEVSAIVFVPEPSEVQNLVASIDASTLAITLTWDAPANNNIILTYSYDVKFNGIFYQNLTTNSLVYTQTVAGGTYPFEIIPLHKSQVSTQTKSINVQIPSSGAPVNLTSSYDSSCNVILNWSQPSNASAVTVTSYNIYNASNNLIVSTANLTYTFLNQVVGQSYSYTVKSVHDSYIGSGASTTIAIPVPAPAISVNSSFDTTGSISLTWNYPETMVNIDNFAIFDIYNNILSPSIPASPSNANYFFVMGNAYPLGSAYSFYILSYNKGVASIASMQTTVSLPIPSVPLGLVIYDNPTTPPNATLTWSPPANNNVISSDSYNVYQDGVLVHNVVQPTFNTAQLVAGQTYSFVVKPLHGSVEFNNPASISLTAYQPSSVPVNLVAQPKNNTIILSWQNPVNTGGLTPYQFNLSYVNDSGVTVQSTIMYSSTNTIYAQTITGLTNKTTYNFNMFLMTGSGTSSSPYLPGQTASVSASPSGNPIVTSIVFANKTLTASIDGNGSNLLANFIIISYDSSNVPSVNQYMTPSSNPSNGLYNITQLLPSTAVKASLVCANSAGITSANSW